MFESCLGEELVGEVEELGVGVWVIDVFSGCVFFDELGVFFVGEIVG